MAMLIFQQILNIVHFYSLKLRKFVAQMHVDSLNIAYTVTAIACTCIQLHVCLRCAWICMCKVVDWKSTITVVEQLHTVQADIVKHIKCHSN